ncbi:MAG: RDD family protein [Gammaproteobacteria bacterium]
MQNVTFMDPLTMDAGSNFIPVSNRRFVAWRRFFARMTDLFLISICLYVPLWFWFISFILDQTKTIPSSQKNLAALAGLGRFLSAYMSEQYILGVIMVTLISLCVFGFFGFNMLLNAVCTTLFGNTFGKFIFAVQAVQINGSKLSFTRILKREFWIFMSGTWLWAYFNFKKNGLNFWDRKTRSMIIESRPYSIGVFITCAIFVIILRVMMFVFDVSNI